MYSADNLAELSRGFGRYILAVPMRKVRDIEAEELTRPGRYKPVADRSRRCGSAQQFSMRLNRVCAGMVWARWVQNATVCVETGCRCKMTDSHGSGCPILYQRACARCPAGFIAKLFGPVSRQASWIEHHLSPTRHRYGGVFGVFHAEPVVPRSSAAVRGGPWAIQLRESVRHTEDPSDNHIRDMLDPASPTLLYPAFAEAVTQLGRIEGGLDVFRRLDGRVLIAL